MAWSESETSERYGRLSRRNRELNQLLVDERRAHSVALKRIAALLCLSWNEESGKFESVARRVEFGRLHMQDIADIINEALAPTADGEVSDAR